MVVVAVGVRVWRRVQWCFVGVCEIESHAFPLVRLQTPRKFNYTLGKLCVAGSRIPNYG